MRAFASEFPELLSYRMQQPQEGATADLIIQAVREGTAPSQQVLPPPSPSAGGGGATFSALSEVGSLRAASMQNGRAEDEAWAQEIGSRLAPRGGEDGTSTSSEGNHLMCAGIELGMEVDV